MTQSSQFDISTPVYNVVPEEWENARAFLTERLKAISNAIDIREVGLFIDEEILSGQQFIPSSTPVQGNSQQFRSIFRKVIDFGSLPNAGTKSVAHGVTVDANFILTNLYLAATDPIGLVGFSLQYYSIAAGDIKLSYDSTNVIVTTASNYSAYSTSFVIMEYVQQL